MPRQPYTEVGILGDVMRIPSAKLLKNVAAKKQGGAPQRDNHSQPGNARQHNAPPRCVFNRETARNPVSTGVIIIEHPLNAGDIIRRLGKIFNNAVDLVDFGRILGIPYADDSPAAKIQGIVQRARLCA